MVNGVTAMLMGGLLVHFGAGATPDRDALLLLRAPRDARRLWQSAGRAHRPGDGRRPPPDPLGSRCRRAYLNYDAPVWVVGVHALFVVLEAIAVSFIARELLRQRDRPREDIRSPLAPRSSITGTPRCAQSFRSRRRGPVHHRATTGKMPRERLGDPRALRSATSPTARRSRATSGGPRRPSPPTPRSPGPRSSTARCRARDLPLPDADSASRSPARATTTSPTSRSRAENLRALLGRRR